MKFTILALLVSVLFVGIANLLGTLGFLGTPSYEYKALAASQMDEIGFRKLAEKNGIEVGDNGKIQFPNEMRQQMLKFNMLPFTITEVEKDGGWNFVSVTADNHYLFRKKN